MSEITTQKAYEIATIAAKRTPCSDAMRDCFLTEFAMLIREIEQ